MPPALDSEEGHAFDPAEPIAVVGMGMRVPVVPLIASAFGTVSVVLFVRNTSLLPAGIELMVNGTAVL
jgi:hypothetical protein